MPRTLSNLCLIILISFIFVRSTFAGVVGYIYDDNGRLIKAISETGSAAAYTYRDTR